ncbi:MAG: 2-dehydro-3-deoxyphosphogluconate aldolase [Candidatus Eisenbacteria bacterium]|nr:2-dehydro-3-deoxyphosphogluconate aldolase [Candidatus Eisenbacteria bacterium]
MIGMKTAGSPRNRRSMEEVAAMSERRRDPEATLAAILEEGVILCVRLGEDDLVLKACRAALRGGLRVLEVTLTTPGALDIIERLAAEGEGVVGGGTVLTVEDARNVAAAGGRFALSPVFDPDVVEEAERLGLLAVPGAATPAEILRAHRHGARLVKVFPARALGGPDFLRAVRGPLPNIPLAATSGPSSTDLADYFAAGAAAVGVGGEVFHPGFTTESVAGAAAKVQQAVRAYRATLRADSHSQ